MTKTLTLRQRATRILKRTAIAAALLCILGNVVYAFAEGSGQPGQTIPTLSWIQLTDSKGINLWQYELSINFKKDVFEAGSMISAMFTQMLWQGYLGCAAVAIWFVDWVLSFDWLNIIVGPLRAIGDSIRDIISRFGLMPAFLMVSGLVGSLFVFAGKTARGLYEILVGALVVALAATVLSNPIDLVAGQDGLIYQTKDYTLDVVAAMGDQAQTDQSSITSQLIKTFVRQPIQVISFGQVLDGTSCEDAYDKAVAGGPYGYENNIRDAVNSCNADAGKYAETPNLGMLSSVFIQGPAGLLVMILAVLIGGSVMLALVSAILAALKAIINLALAALPGGARRPLAQSLSEIAMGLAMFTFSLFFLAVYLMVIQTIYSSAGGQPSSAFAVTLIFMTLGLVAFWRYRKSLKAATQRLTDLLSKRPGGGSPRPLASSGNSGMFKMAAAYGGSKLLTSPKGRAALKGAAMVGAGLLTGNPALAAKAIFSGRGKKLLGTAGKAVGKKVAAGGAKPILSGPKGAIPGQAAGPGKFGPRAAPLRPRKPTSTTSTTGGRPRLRTSGPGDAPPLHRRRTRGQGTRNAPHLERGRSKPQLESAEQTSQTPPRPRRASMQRRSTHYGPSQGSRSGPSRRAGSSTGSQGSRSGPNRRPADGGATRRPTETPKPRIGQSSTTRKSPALRRGSSRRPRR